jgi:crooked neck
MEQLEQQSTSKRLPRGAGVQNKAAATRQITAEQLLRDAADHRDVRAPPPNRIVADTEELADYRLQKRKQFEDQVRRSRYAIGIWIKYATWEASQKEFERARSVFERARDVDYKNVGLWLKYAEMEMKNKFVNRARNVWDRAVSLLPRVDQLWLKYALMEEQLENYAGAKQVFERWMQWAPDPRAWDAYVQFELRYHHIEQVRDIYERFIICHPEVATYLLYAKFEEKHGTTEHTRNVFERCSRELGLASETLDFFLAFARFEERHRELERARVIYEFGLEQMRQRIHNGESEREVAESAAEMFRRYTAFQRQHGDMKSADNAVLQKRRLQYEEDLKDNPTNYDVWFDYIKLEQSAGLESEEDYNRIREIFERAVANIPPVEEKRYWRRYIYLWIYYAVFEELESKNYARCEEVLKTCLQIIPHSVFTFSKIWLMYAHFKIRRLELTSCRKLLGSALGKCPTRKLFKRYIELEFSLAEFDRCRILYEKFLEFDPNNSQTWCDFAELESNLGEIDRARALYELSVSQSTLDVPELVWKSYLDFELQQGEIDRARDLYSRLLEQSKHVKVWISRAQFECELEDFHRAREVFSQAEEYFKETGDKESRLIILESWREFEKTFGDDTSLSLVDRRLPQRITRKRPIIGEDGEEAGTEEYFEYIFPEESQPAKGLAILQAAKRWKSGAAS